MQGKRLDQPFVQRQEENQEEETEQVQAKRVSTVAVQRPGLSTRLQSLQGGEPLPPSTCAFFEPRFGADFGHVRVHSNSAAAETAQQINAQAFTRGRDIVFGPSRYQPQTPEGQRLLAHELTHVVQQQGGTIAAPAGTSPDGNRITVYPANRSIQRQSASRICGQETLQVPVPVITTSGSGGGTRLNLGPFSCPAGKCQVQKDSQPVDLPVLKQSASDLVRSIRFSENLITKIPGYLKSAPASETYEKFIQWMHKTTGVAPVKPGTQPSAAVAAETTAFIDPGNIMSEWSRLGEISPPKGNDPIGNWISEVHEQHHRKTILTNPDVDKAYGEIRKTRAALLADQNMLAPYDQNLKSKADKDIPAHIQNESSVIAQEKQTIWTQINLKSGSRLNVVGMDKLLPLIKGMSEEAAIRRLMNRYKTLGALERAYDWQAALLARKLKQYYGQYAQGFEKTRSFGKEDLKAYCLSWQAEKKALDFIKRCCPSMKSSPLRAQPGRGIRRMKINTPAPSEITLQRLKDKNFDDCDRGKKEGEKDQITRAHEKAMRLLTHAVAELKLQPHRHHLNLGLIFGIKDVAGEKEKLQKIIDAYLVAFMGLIGEKFTYECDYKEDWNLGCREGAHAWTSTAGFADIHICWDFFAMEPEEQAGTILHEALHKWPGLGDDQSDPFDNAYAYESFARSTLFEPLSVEPRGKHQ